MFEEEVKECVRFGEFEREEQIAFGRGEVRIDKGSGLEAEGTPIHGVGDLFGQIVLKEATGVFRVGKSGFEKFVVWMMDGFL